MHAHAPAQEMVIIDNLGGCEQLRASVVKAKARGVVYETVLMSATPSERGFRLGWLRALGDSARTVQM